MWFAWDPAKSETNLEERGFDFEFELATLIFNGPTVEVEDRRRDYRERRMVAIGLADGVHLTVVHTDRHAPDGLHRRIISARRSNRREQGIYSATTTGHSGTE